MKGGMNMEKHKKNDVDNWLRDLSSEKDPEKLKENKEFISGLTFN